MRIRHSGHLLLLAVQLVLQRRVGHSQLILAHLELVQPLPQPGQAVAVGDEDIQLAPAGFAGLDQHARLVRVVQRQGGAEVHAGQVALYWCMTDSRSPSRSTLLMMSFIVTTSLRYALRSSSITSVRRFNTVFSY